MRRLLVLLAVASTSAGSAHAAVRIVETFPLDRYAASGAIGLAVPGAGPTVTRESALNTLRTGEVESSLLGGTPTGAPRSAALEGNVVVVLPPPGRSENRRYPIAQLGGELGVLTSDSTRIDGLVSLADVPNDELRVVAVADPVAVLERLDRRIDWNDRWRLALSILLGGVGYVVALIAPRFAPRVFLVGLALNLWLAGWWVVALLGLAAALLPLGLACGSVIGIYLLLLGLDPETIALSPLGPSQAGRFYGLSNLLATALLVPALVGAAVLGRAGIATAVGALVLVGGNRFGADGGGLIVLLAAYGTLVVRRRGARLTPRSLTVLAVATVVSGLVLVGLDVVLGSSSHVTDSIGAGPTALLGDLLDRLELSVRRSTTGIGPAFACLASLAVVLWVAIRRGKRAVTDAFLVALATSLLLNDTPGDVLGLGAAGLFVVWRWECTFARTLRPRLVRLRSMRRSSAVLALIASALALAAAGCGGEEVTATPETVVGEVPTETSGGSNEDLPALELTGDSGAGESVWTANGCGSCHTLAAAGASGKVGPNLDDSKPSYELVVERVTLGQGGMPAFGEQLEPQQIADVAQYVVESSSG